MKNLAIIPARGGSKRIHRKNIKHFLGKPIIAYSIEAALESNLFDEVMVSTDDEEIATVARRYGASVPFMRTKKNADDFATTADVLLEVLLAYEKNNQKFNNVCCIYATAPFVSVSELIETYKMLNDCTSVVPVVAFDFPILRSFVLNATNNIRYAWPEFAMTRSQDLEKHYHDVGQWYWVKNKTFLAEKTLITSHCKGFIKSAMLSQDIDNEEDWKMAEMKYKIAFNQK
jgi:N-acylneuraminate cytidylyltransferase